MSEPRIIQTEPITHRGGVPLRRIVAAIIGRKQRTVRLDCGHTALVRDRRTQWWPCVKCGRGVIMADSARPAAGQ